MSVFEVVALFSLGAGIGHVGPRLPTLWMTRAKGFNTRFPPHPEPVPLSPYLTQRGCTCASSLVEFRAWRCHLAFGAASSAGAPGLRIRLVGGRHLDDALSLATSHQRPTRPWTKDLAVELQSVMDRSRIESCCSHPAPVWMLQSISCSACGAVLSRTPRPDLGRPRSDGRIAGTLRLLITDGYPLAEPSPNRLHRKNRVLGGLTGGTFEKSPCRMSPMERRPTVGSLIARVGLTGQLLGQIFLTPMAAFGLTYLLVFTAEGGDFRLSIEVDMIPWIGMASLFYGMLALALALGMGGSRRFVSSRQGLAFGTRITRHQGSSVHRFAARQRYAASSHGRLSTLVYDRFAAGHALWTIRGSLSSLRSVSSPSCHHTALLGVDVS